MRRRLFDSLSRLVVYRYRLVLAVAMVVTAACLALASAGIRLETRILDLLPSDDPAAVQYEAIVKQYDSASQIIVGVEGGTRQDKIAFIEALAGRMSEVVYTGEDGEKNSYIKRFRVREDVDFIANKGLLLTEKRDLQNLEELMFDLGYVELLSAHNDFLEREYIEDSAAVTDREKEDRAIAGLKAVKVWLEGLKQQSDDPRVQNARAEQAADLLSIGDPYSFSQDDSLLIAMATPAISVDSMDETIEGVGKLQAIVDELSESRPGIEARLAGMPALMYQEMQVGFEDMGASTVISLLLVLALFVLAFRMLTAPILAMISLIVGICWSAGFIALTFGRLNLFTLMFAVILIGLGIDFAIHLLSAYTTARGEGKSLLEAVGAMFDGPGAGVVTGALTTSAAFFALALTGLEALVELGVILGSGILLTLVASLTVLPAGLVLRERIWAKAAPKRAQQTKPVRLTMPVLGSLGEAIQRRPWGVVGLFALSTMFSVYYASRAEYEPDMLETEPPDMDAVTLHRDVLEKFELHPDFAMMVTHDLDKTRGIVKKMKKNRLVGRVDAVSEFVPSTKQQDIRIPIARRIQARMDEILRARTELGDATADADDPNVGRPDPQETKQKLLDELERLQNNVQEIGQLAFASVKNRLYSACERLSGGKEGGGAFVALRERVKKIPAKELQGRIDAYEDAYIPKLATKLRAMSETEPITVQNLPEEIKERYLGTGGANLITVYASVNLWEGDKAKLFIDHAQKVDAQVTGSVVMMNRLIELIGSEGLAAVLFALGAVFMILIVDFRSTRLALLAMCPLGVGFVMMIGAFVLLGRKFDVVNLEAIPLILGIGIDDAVHIVHAVRRRGAGALSDVLRDTGRALVLTSLTTGIAFGSIAVASHRGMASMGLLLVLGVVACLLASILLLPALLRITQKRTTSKQSQEV